MTIQKLLAPFRRAVNDYQMISDGDKIAVGISGGKDSLTLLELLNAYRRFATEKFDVIGISIDMGLQEHAYDEIAKYCQDKQIEYHVVPTNIGEIIFQKTPDNPCSLCAKMRRGALNTTLVSLGCNKLALGHHSDDVIETFFLSLLYEGRLSTFAPKSYLSRMQVTVIRPMVYLEEKDIAAYAKILPVLHNPCPADKHTQRQYMKELISSIQKDIPFAKERITSAVMHPERYNLWDDVLDKYAKERLIPPDKES